MLIQSTLVRDERLMSTYRVVSVGPLGSARAKPQINILVSVDVIAARVLTCRSVTNPGTSLSVTATLLVIMGRWGSVFLFFLRLSKPLSK